MGIRTGAIVTAALALAAGPAGWAGPRAALAQDPNGTRLMMQMQMPGLEPMPAPDREGPIPVRIRFNFHVPLDDMKPETLAWARNRGRGLIYRMTDGECGVLKSTIAETCRLAGINVRARVRAESRTRPAALSVNGNARYAITLKE